MTSVFGKHTLIPHPAMPPKTIERVTVWVRGDAAGVTSLEYNVAPSQSLVVPELAEPARADGLWQTTCFELFAKPIGGEGYFEFNFSPSCRWAAYEFDGYRAGMRDLECLDPEILVTPKAGWEDYEHFFLGVEALPALPPVASKASFSAVIEEKDGTKSFWALAHPPEAPDFHHADCFVLELPAAV